MPREESSASSYYGLGAVSYMIISKTRADPLGPRRTERDRRRPVQSGDEAGRSSSAPKTPGGVPKYSAIPRGTLGGGLESGEHPGRRRMTRRASGHD